MKAGIIGVSGYGGGEIARLLLGHPNLELTYVTSGTYEGKSLCAALPGVTGRTELICEKFDADTAIERCDVVFLAGENGLAMKTAPKLLTAGKKIVDLSADFRLSDPVVYKQWYKMDHVAVDLLPSAVYGLPELNRDLIKNAQLVANPGCYPTSAILAIAPLIKNNIIDRKSIIVDSHSGVSGAGRSKFCLDYHFSEINESIKPYGVGGVHRHTPEIEQILGDIAGEPITLTFTPHLAPITRGILTTAYANIPEVIAKAGVNALHKLYTDFYASEPFVNVLEPGQYPATKHTFGTNYCHIGVAVDARTSRAIIVSAEDNLVKGAAGQAIQNMNLMCGFDETDGLTMSSVWP